MRKGLIIILIVIVVAGVGWYLYAKSRQTAPGVPAITDFSAFFPIGDSGDPTNIPGLIPDTPTSTIPISQSAAPSAFRLMSASAVAGYSAFTQSSTLTIAADPNTPKAKPTLQTVIKRIVRYVSRSNGYVYEIEDDAVPLQISNVYIPNIYETVFADKSTTALLRFIRPDARTVATYSVPIPPPNPNGTRTQHEGVYLPDNIISAVASPDGTQVARIAIDANGALLSTTTSLNAKKVDIVSTPFREWILSWPTAKTIYLQTKATAQAPGYLYKIDTTEKKLRRVIGDINGLTASVSPSGAYILYSQSTDTAFVSKILNTKNNTTRTLNIKVMPEKCAWLTTDDLICAGNDTVAEAQYPDAWYQGTISFSDKLYRINTGAVTATTLYDNTSASYDMTMLSVDEGAQRVYFVDKQTGLLWQFSY